MTPTRREVAFSGACSAGSLVRRGRENVQWSHREIMRAKTDDERSAAWQKGQRGRAQIETGTALLVKWGLCVDTEIAAYETAMAICGDPQAVGWAPPEGAVIPEIDDPDLLYAERRFRNDW